MNMTTVIDDIKMGLGLQTVALPFDEPIENVIRKSFERSIRTFSRYAPLIKEGYADRSQLRKAGREDINLLGIYFLPDFLCTTPVSYADAFIATSPGQVGEVTTTTFTVGSPFVGFGSYYPQDILNATVTGAAINKYAGVTSRQPSSKWLGYNRIQLFDFPDKCWIRFVVKCEHDLSGETIQESQVESFMQLAELDLKRFLYNSLKNMTSVGSGFKDIQLKIDDWASAESERNALIEKWDGRYYIDDDDLIQFF